MINKQERRRAPRFRAFSRPVGLHDGSVVTIGRSRDLSNEGMRLVHPIPVETGQILEIAFSPVLSLRAEVVWVNGDECGVAFEEPVDAVALLDDLASCQSGKRANQEAEWPGRMIDAGADASNAAVKFRPGLHVKLRLRRGAEKPATVRWAGKRGATLVLLNPFVAD